MRVVESFAKTTNIQSILLQNNTMFFLSIEILRVAETKCAMYDMFTL